MKDDVYIVPPLARRKGEGAFIYFALCHSPDRQIKIGYTRDVSHRISTIRNGCPYEIALLAFYVTVDFAAAELALFQRFAAARIRGEWFHPVPELVAHIAELQELQSPVAFSRMLSS